MNKPILGITMGDPFGNGPEITVRALNDKTIYDRCRPLVVGDLTSMEYALRVARKVSGINLELNPVQKVQDAKFTYGTIDVLDMGLVPADQIPDTADQDEPKPFGIGACALGGEASFQYVKKVIELAMAGEIDATITNALSKEAINMAGHHYSGHTEIYADYPTLYDYSHCSWCRCRYYLRINPRPDGHHGHCHVPAGHLLHDALPRYFHADGPVHRRHFGRFDLRYPAEYTRYTFLGGHMF